jgi:6,7-dimethyl-8-ribityllumazine synthase
VIPQLQGTTGSVSGKNFSVLVSKYHTSITSKLLDGATSTLTRNEVPETNIQVGWVPGAWELPTAAKFALSLKKFDAVICLGCVIRGETSHDQHINTTISNNLSQLSLDFSTPVAFGVLTCNTMEQAIARSGGDVGNKGVEAAEAVIHMLLLFDEMKNAD